MSQELQNLLRKAVESNRENEESKIFFIWLEEKFGITDYEKILNHEGRIAAKIGSVILFKSETEELGVDVYNNCQICVETGVVHFLGSVNSLAELGNFVLSEETKNFNLICPIINLSEVRSRESQNESIDGKEFESWQNNLFKIKTTEKPHSLSTYMSSKNYESFMGMEEELSFYFRKKFKVKLKYSNVSELAIIYACNSFQNNQKDFLTAIEKQLLEYS